MRLRLTFAALVVLSACSDAEPEPVTQPCPGDLVRNAAGECVAPTTGPSECDPEGLRIDEVFANPEGDDVGFEYVELRGRTDQSLSGIRLVVLDGDAVAVADHALTGRADAVGVFVVGGDQTDADFPLEESLLNTVGAVQLVDCEGNVVDAVAWGAFADGTSRPGEGDPAPVPPEGAAIGRCALAEDTDDNRTDFGVASPSPGQPNPGDSFVDGAFCGEDPSGCEPGALRGNLRIEEIVYNPEGSDAGNEYIELRGTPGSVLDGVRIEGVNGANGAGLFAPVVLAGAVGADGVFVVGGAGVSATDYPLGEITLQNGPDTIVLVDCDGRTRLDAVGYGNFGDEHQFMGEGTPAPAASEGFSVSRCGDNEDTGDNGADFGIATPTPGALAAPTDFEDPLFCERNGTPCVVGELEIAINEVLFAPADGAPEFIELRGTPGASVNRASVEVVNGNNGEAYGSRVSLAGAFDENGLFLIAAEGLEGDAVLPFAIQNGPDSVLVYDCDGETPLDAVAYGTFGEGEISAGEGTSAPSSTGGASIARCAGAADTNDNGADFGLATPTPGVANSGFVDTLFCEETPDCVIGAVGAVRINEVLANPEGADGDSDAEFIELRGTPGASLDGLRVAGVNGSNGEPFFGPVRLGGTFGEDGYFLIGQENVADRDLDLAGDLQNGPESIVLYDCDGTTVLDAMGYGNFDDEDVFAGEGESAPVGDGKSTSRCEDRADTDNNRADFGTATPTPGAPNTGFDDPLLCVDVGPCTPIAAGTVLINEVLYNPPGADTGAEFVELLGPADLDITGVTLVGVNGNGGAEYITAPILGALNGSGFYVLGGALVPESDALLPTTLQNGPDSLELRDCEGSVIDAVAYGSFGDEDVFAGEGTAAPTATDTSIGRLAGVDTNDNSFDFVTQTTPTPGAANSGGE